MDYKNGKIYCIYNYINNEIYVGSTCQTLSKRMAEHRQQLNCMKAKHRNLYKSMNEHGSENFYIELYEEYPCENKAQLQRREGEVIREVGTLNKKIEGRTRKEYYEDNFEHLQKHKKDYWHSNRDYLLEKKREYCEKNKDEIKEKKKQYLEENREAINERKRQSYYENRDEILQKQKEYTERNREAVLQRKRDYTARTKEQKREYDKQYREQNKEMLKDKKAKYYKQVKGRLSEKIVCEVCGATIQKRNVSHKKTQQHQQALENLNNINNVLLQTDNWWANRRQTQPKRI